MYIVLNKVLQQFEKTGVQHKEGELVFLKIKTDGNCSKGN